MDATSDLQNVKASIVIPVYNAERYLRDCLDSAINQTLSDIEIICVDDASTDQSMAIMQEYASKDDRIRIITQEHRGGGAARNNGLEHACGKYIFFMDSDDTCSPDLLKHTVAAAEREKADIVCFDYKKVDSVGNRKKHRGYNRRWLPRNAKVFNYLACPTKILSVVNVTPWNKLFLRSFILDNGLRYEEISSTNDITFAALSCARASRIATVNKTLYFYRVGHSQTTTSTKAKNINNVCIAIESTIRQVTRLPYYDEIKDSLSRFVVDNYVVGLTRYVPDITAPEAKDFYETMHETFQRREFADLDAEQLDSHSLYRQYRTIRDNTYEDYVFHSGKRIIVALTSFPARIKYVRKALDTIFAQTKQPDEVVLYLAEDQFPKRELDLPNNVIRLALSGKLTIKWCQEDLKPHKKYFYAFQDYPNDLIITVDDDLLYPKDMVESLYSAYMVNHHAVCAMRAHLIPLDSKGQVLPYKYWAKEFDCKSEKPYMQLLCTGGAGALYPAELFKGNPLLDERAIMDNCPLADDLWLKFIELVSGVPVVLAGKNAGLHFVPGSQDEALFKTNIEKNDKQWRNCVQYVEQIYGEGFVSRQLRQPTDGDCLYDPEAIYIFYTEKLDHQRKEIVRRLTSSSSYRIGRIITLPARMIKLMIKDGGKIVSHK